jgi:DNA-binding Lrp family transcriptional regulator
MSFRNLFFYSILIPVTISESQIVKFVLHSIEPASYTGSYTAEYRVIIAGILKNMGRKLRNPTIGSNNKINDKDSQIFPFDSIDINIIRELLDKADIRSADIASKYNVPISTIQRRRKRLVDSILEKKYLIDITKRDLRTGIILANVERGKAKEVAKTILERHKSNAISSSTRINDQNNVITEIIYNNSSELYNILEQVKKIPYVSSATWSELVEVVGNNDAPIIAALSRQKG